MIKRCQVCNRTYSDETISFCLADGALLSAPYDQSGPPTEVLPASLAPTQQSPQAAPMPTIAAPPPKLAGEIRADSPAPANSGVKRVLLAVAGLAILALGGAIVYLLVPFLLWLTIEHPVIGVPIDMIVIALVIFGFVALVIFGFNRWYQRRV